MYGSRYSTPCLPSSSARGEPAGPLHFLATGSSFHLNLSRGRGDMVERLEIGDRVPAAERVVASALEAFEAGRWNELYDFTDRDTLAKLMQKFMRTKEERINRPPPPDSWEPLSPMEEEVREMLRMAAELPVTFYDLAHVRSIDEARALDPRAFIARWAEARYDGAGRGARDGVPASSRVVVGSLAILPDYAMVVTRWTQTGSTSPLHVLSNIGVIGDGRGEWRLDASAQ